jgi:hypothetical protein
MHWHNVNELPLVNVPLDHREIYVFSTDLSGEHTSTEAGIAVSNFGAKRGKGNGLSCQSYAIPISDYSNIMTLEIIGIYVEGFIRLTKIHDRVKFFVTRIGCDIYSDEHISQLFRGCGNNCNMPIEWKQYLED